MPSTLHILTLAVGASAVQLQGPPQYVSLINDSLQSWAPSHAQYMPDGKMFAFRQNLTDPQTPWIFNIELDFRMTGPTNKVKDITAPASANRSDYPNRLPWRADINYVEVPNTIPIPSPSVTGMRSNGTLYDENSVWLMNVFRLSETSNASAPSNYLIGFAHNEDYWGHGGAVNGCTYKSIGVRYSYDLGLSWTRSVPILTKSIETQTPDGCNVAPRAGTADFAATWNHLTSTWTILGCEDEWTTNPSSPGLVTSISADPLARPGSWTKVDPVRKLTAPGLIGSNATFLHPDLSSGRGANPSIIRDQKNGVWHMVYAKWGGGLFYTKTPDLVRWTSPALLPINGTQHPQSGYPTLIGDLGDTNTTNGLATLYWTDSAVKPTGMWGRPFWSVDLDLGASTNAAEHEDADNGDQIVLETQSESRGDSQHVGL